MAATIYDVAKKAGVSTATVSKVLSNTPYVSAPTRAKVLDAVAELDYVPSLMARGLSKAQTYILALVIPYTPSSGASTTRPAHAITASCFPPAVQSPLASPPTVPRTADPPGCIGVVMSMASS